MHMHMYMYTCTCKKKGYCSYLMAARPAPTRTIQISRRHRRGSVPYTVSLMGHTVPIHLMMSMRRRRRRRRGRHRGRREIRRGVLVRTDRVHVTGETSTGPGTVHHVRMIGRSVHLLLL